MSFFGGTGKGIQEAYEATAAESRTYANEDKSNWPAIMRGNRTGDELEVAEARVRVLLQENTALREKQDALYRQTLTQNLTPADLLELHSEIVDAVKAELRACLAQGLPREPFGRYIGPAVADLCQAAITEIKEEILADPAMRLELADIARREAQLFIHTRFAGTAKKED